MAKYYIRLWDAFSQFLNVLLLNGDPNHSISGDAYRYKRIRSMNLIDFVLGKNHCMTSHLNDVSKARKLLEEHNTSLLKRGF
jgi:hypothetical protein